MGGGVLGIFPLYYFFFIGAEPKYDQLSSVGEFFTFLLKVIN